MDRLKRKIETIPVGTWEDKHFRCPPASKKSVSQVIADLNSETGLTRPRDAERRQRRKGETE